MSWPEEMSFIANSSKIDRRKGKYLPAINQACSGGGGGEGGSGSHILQHWCSGLTPFPYTTITAMSTSLAPPSRRSLLPLPQTLNFLQALSVASTIEQYSIGPVCIYF